AGQHQLLAYTNASTAVINIALSIALIGPLGLAGVALGTLIPVSAAAIFVLFPAACRRVGLPLAYPIFHAILPALWPAAVMAVVMSGLVRHLSGSLFEIAIQMAVGGIVYAALFIALAIGAEERGLY